MAATPSIKIEKSSEYKGSTRVWSNRYHFSGGTPAGSGAWTTLADAVVAAEALALYGNTTIVEAVGYDAGSDVPVFTKTYSTAGSVDASDGIVCPLPVAALIRYSTDVFTSKHHPVYLFNYVHQVLRTNASSNYETLATHQKTALETYATHWLSGFSDGTNEYLRAGPNGAVAQARTVNQFLTHRDFPT